MEQTFLISIFSMAFALFLLMDPIGNVPLFVAVLKNVPASRQKKIILRELVIALFVIILFEFLGNALMRLLNVKLHTLLIAGGIILFIIALRMIFPTRQDPEIDPSRHKEPFIVPLAIPLVAGPAVLAAVMLYAGQNLGHVAITLAVVIAWIASTLILLCSSLLKKRLGARGLVACERLMGLILTLIAVQMFLGGVTLYMESIRTL